METIRVLKPHHRVTDATPKTAGLVRLQYEEVPSLEESVFQCDDLKLNIPAGNGLPEERNSIKHHGIATIRLVLTHRQTTLDGGTAPSGPYSSKRPKLDFAGPPTQMLAPLSTPGKITARG
jgi:hypothetical protein